MHSTSPSAVRFAPTGTSIRPVQNLWPLAVIILGLVLSAAWCVGLLWSAYLLLDWAGAFAVTPNGNEIRTLLG